MASRPVPVRKADIERAVKGVIACGLTVTRVEFEGGKLVVHTSDREAGEDPLETWRRSNGPG